MRLNFRTVKVMLYWAIRRNTALQCWNNVATIRNIIATMLQRRVTACTKNGCCESSRVISPLRLFRVNVRIQVQPVENSPGCLFDFLFAVAVWTS